MDGAMPASRCYFTSTIANPGYAVAIHGAFCLVSAKEHVTRRHRITVVHIVLKVDGCSGNFSDIRVTGFQEYQT